MIKLENIYDVIEELNKGEYLSTDGLNIFFMKNNKIRIKSQNANYYLELEDFIKIIIKCYETAFYKDIKGKVNKMFNFKL